MKLLLKDLAKLIVILLIWNIILNYFFSNGYYRLYESFKYFPFHLVVTIGYYAIITVCIKMLSIKDCEDDHTKLISEIEEAKAFFIKNKVKFN